eukprot:g3140.t1
MCKQYVVCVLRSKLTQGRRANCAALRVHRPTVEGDEVREGNKEEDKKAPSLSSSASDVAFVSLPLRRVGIDDRTSFHLPLHRFYTALALRVAEITGRVDSESKTTTQSALALLEYPLRCLACDAQIECGMWRRNGHSLLNARYNYARVPLAMKFRDLDLRALQIGVLRSGPTLVLGLALKHFGLLRRAGYTVDQYAFEDDLSASHDGIGGEPSETDADDEYANAMGERFFALVATIATELPWASDQLRLVREVTHCLAAAGAAGCKRSRLESCMGASKLLATRASTSRKFSNKEASVDAAIEEVAERVGGGLRAADGLRTTTFRLRDDKLDSYDHYFYHLGREAHQKAMDHVREQQKRRAKKISSGEGSMGKRTDVDVRLRLQLPPVTDALPAFRSVRKAVLLHPCFVPLVADAVGRYVRAIGIGVDGNDDNDEEEEEEEEEVRSLEGYVAAATHVLALAAHWCGEYIRTRDLKEGTKESEDSHVREFLLALCRGRAAASCFDRSSLSSLVELLDCVRRAQPTSPLGMRVDGILSTLTAVDRVVTNGEYVASTLKRLHSTRGERSNSSNDGSGSEPSTRNASSPDTANRHQAAKDAQRRALEAIAKKQATFAAMMMSSSEEEDGEEEDDEEDDGDDRRFDDPLGQWRTTNVSAGEFLCPLCKTLSNTLVPRCVPITSAAFVTGDAFSTTNATSVECDVACEDAVVTSLASRIVRWITDDGNTHHEKRSAGNASSSSSPQPSGTAIPRSVAAQDFSFLQSIGRLCDDADTKIRDEGNDTDDAGLTSLSPQRLALHACRMLATTLQTRLTTQNDDRVRSREMRSLVQVVLRTKDLELPVDLRDSVFSRRARFEEVAHVSLRGLFRHGYHNGKFARRDAALTSATPVTSPFRVLLHESPLAVFAEGAAVFLRSSAPEELLKLIDCVRVLAFVQVLIRGYALAVEATKVSKAGGDDAVASKVTMDAEPLPTFVALAAELHAASCEKKGLTPTTRKVHATLSDLRELDARLRANAERALAHLMRGVEELVALNISKTRNIPAGSRFISAKEISVALSSSSGVSTIGDAPPASPASTGCCRNRADLRTLVLNAWCTSCQTHRGDVGDLRKRLVQIVSWRRTDVTSSCDDGAVSDWKPRLVDLPDLFEDLLMRAETSSCPTSRPSKRRDSPAMCLICGELMCSGSGCPCKRGEVGPLTRHVVEKHCGVGAALMLSSSEILLFRGAQCCRFPSPYVDAFGEEDLNLRRGRPLSLSPRRYAVLSDLETDTIKWIIKVAQRKVKSYIVLRGYAVVKGKEDLKFNVVDATEEKRRDVLLLAKNAKEMKEWQVKLEEAIGLADKMELCRRTKSLAISRLETAVKLDHALPRDKSSSRQAQILWGCDLQPVVDAYMEGIGKFFTSIRIEEEMFGHKPVPSLLWKLEQHVKRVEYLKAQQKRLSPASSFGARRKSTSVAGKGSDESSFVERVIRTGLRQAIVEPASAKHSSAPTPRRDDGVTSSPTRFTDKLRLKFEVDDTVSCEFKVYAPEVYKDLRAFASPSKKRGRCVETEFVKSMCSMPLVGGGMGEGKSGALFFFSSDSRYVVKTVTENEHAFLLQLLKDYYRHFEYFPSTFVCRFVAHFSFSSSRHAKKRFVVMENLLFDDRGRKFDFRFDLKGSTVSRIVDTSKICLSKVTLKDLNFRECHKVVLPKSIARRIHKQLAQDAALLQSHGVMDYSLLLAIRFGPGQRRELSSASGDAAGGILDRRGTTYTFGIIDILQQYNFVKTAEHNFKKIVLGQGEEMSAVPSTLYKRRFLQFLETVIVGTTDANFGALFGGRS